MIERLAVDHPDVFDVYARFARQNHGALIRSAFNWEEYWRFENEEERTRCLLWCQSRTFRSTFLLGGR